MWIDSKFWLIVYLGACDQKMCSPIPSFGSLRTLARATQKCILKASLGSVLLAYRARDTLAKLSGLVSRLEMFEHLGDK